MMRGWMRGLLAATLLLTGCYTISYRGRGSGSGMEKSEWGNYFLWGLVGETDLDLEQACPGGAARWKSQQTFVQGLIGLVTLGIYIPRSVIVECATGAALEIRLDPRNEQPRLSVLEGPGDETRRAP